MRLSYVGELGWELHHDLADQSALYERIVSAGGDLGLVDFGYRALDAMRLEKGYGLWGADLTADWTPLEAGLGRFVKPGKGDFMAARRCSRSWPAGSSESCRPDSGRRARHPVRGRAGLSRRSGGQLRRLGRFWPPSALASPSPTCQSGSPNRERLSRSGCSASGSAPPWSVLRSTTRRIRKCDYSKRERGDCFSVSRSTLVQILARSLSPPRTGRQPLAVIDPRLKTRPPAGVRRIVRSHRTSGSGARPIPPSKFRKKSPSLAAAVASTVHPGGASPLVITIELEPDGAAHVQPLGPDRVAVHAVEHPGELAGVGGRAPLVGDRRPVPEGGEAHAHEPVGRPSCVVPGASGCGSNTWSDSPGSADEVWDPACLRTSSRCGRAGWTDVTQYRPLPPR